MPYFGDRSKKNLSEAHGDLQVLFNEVIKHIDCTVICGYRNEKEQNAAYNSKKSQLKYPMSKHNSLPAMAVDVVPYPIDWKNLNRFYFFAGVVAGIADGLFSASRISHHIRWGGDWNCNNDIEDEKFRDLPHFELISINSN